MDFLVSVIPRNCQLRKIIPWYSHNHWYGHFFCCCCWFIFFSCFCHILAFQTPVNSRCINTWEAITLKNISMLMGTSPRNSHPPDICVYKYIGVTALNITHTSLVNYMQNKTISKWDISSRPMTIGLIWYQAKCTVLI